MLDSSGTEVAHATTESTGRAVVEAKLTMGETYAVREDVVPVASVPPLPPQPINTRMGHRERWAFAFSAASSMRRDAAAAANGDAQAHPGASQD